MYPKSLRPASPRPPSLPPPPAHPRLKQQVYDLVLHSLLPNHADHATLLHLARTWPPGLFSGTSLVEAVVARMKRPPAGAAGAGAGGGGEMRELWLLLSHLYERQVRFEVRVWGCGAWGGQGGVVVMHAV